VRGCSDMRRRGAARLPGQKTACPSPGREDEFCPPMETRVRRAAEFKRNTRPPPVLGGEWLGFCYWKSSSGRGFESYGKKTGGGHALKIIKSGFLSERKVYDTPLAPFIVERATKRIENTPPAPLVEGSGADGADRLHTPNPSRRGELRAAEWI